MLKKNIKWTVAFLILCALCVSLHFFHSGAQRGKTAVIKRGGEVIKTIDLSAVSEPYEIKIEGDGGFNIISVEKDRIAVKDADCPDKLCVKQGFIDTGAYPIVCLPHKVTVSIENGAGEVDAVAGGN